MVYMDFRWVLLNPVYSILPSHPVYHIPLRLYLISQLYVCVVVFVRGEAVLLQALPIPSLSEREPKDARPECPPYAF